MFYFFPFRKLGDGRAPGAPPHLDPLLESGRPPFQNRYIAISQRKIIWFWGNLYTAADFELDVRHVIKIEKVVLDRLRVRQNVFCVWNRQLQKLSYRNRSKQCIGGEAAKNESSTNLLKSRCGSAIWRLAWWLVNARGTSTSVAWIWRS